MTLNNAHAPSHTEIVETAREILKDEGEDAAIEYLHEMASNDFSCPDACDRWALQVIDAIEEEEAQ